MNETKETQHENADFFSIFEKTVIGVYETGQLTPAVLDAIAAIWRGYEMPETGELAARDGCTIDEIVVGTIMGSTADDWGNYLKIRKERWGWK